MTKYIVVAINNKGEEIGNKWTYNKSEVKGIVNYFKKYTFATGVMVNGKVWNF